jgi:hypothetical protein
LNQEATASQSHQGQQSQLHQKQMLNQLLLSLHHHDHQCLLTMNYCQGLVDYSNSHLVFSTVFRLYQILVPYCKKNVDPFWAGFK